MLALRDPPPDAREEEDRVVGDHPEQQHHDHGLDLARNRDPRPLTDPRDQADRNEKGHTHRQQRHERRSDRPEVKADHERDEHYGRGLDQRQRIGDHLRLLATGRHGAGHSHEAIKARLDSAFHEPLGEPLALLTPHVGREEEIGQRSGGPLPRERGLTKRVRDRDRPTDPTQPRVFVPAERERPPGDPRLLGERQPLRAALHDDRPTQKREAEQLARAQLCLDRLRVAGNEIA